MASGVHRGKSAPSLNDKHGSVHRGHVFPTSQEEVETAVFGDLTRSRIGTPEKDTLLVMLDCGKCSVPFAQDAVRTGEIDTRCTKKHIGKGRPRAKAKTGDCSVDCLASCAHPGKFSECSL